MKREKRKTSKQERGKRMLTELLAGEEKMPRSAFQKEKKEGASERKKNKDRGH